MSIGASHLLKQRAGGWCAPPRGVISVVFAAFVAATAPGLSAQDATPHSTARLVSDVASIRAGEPFTVGLHVTLDEGWRTPWENAGDVGNGLIATWTLPAGFSADSFAYPIPERISQPPVASYGYHDDVVFLTTIEPPADLEAGRSVRLTLTADYVICGHTCIPIHAERSLDLPVRHAPPTTSGDAALIRRHADRLPVEQAQWSVRAARTHGGFVLGISPPADWEGSLGGAWFFPSHRALLDHAADQPIGRTATGEYRVRLTESAYLSGEPERIEGVLVLPDGGAFDATGHRGLVVSGTLADLAVAWAAEPTESVAAHRLAGRPESLAGTAGGLLLAVLLALAGGAMLRTRANHGQKQATSARSGRAGGAACVALLAALAAPAGSGLNAQAAPTPAPSEPQDTTPHSQARLVSDVASIRAGEPFTVGLHVTLDEGWHTYWKNAGDAGNGLLATWTLPAGFSADSFAYPIPERIPYPPLVNYGYHDEVVFLATITPPADLEAGQSARLTLLAEFLVCEDICIPAIAERTLELTAGDASPTASSDAALIRRYADRLPVDNPQWTARSARTADGFVLEVAPPDGWVGSLAGAWFFPVDPVLLDHVADQPMGRTAAGAYRLRLTESAYLPGEPERIEGVLVLPDGGAVDAAGHQGLVLNTEVAGPEVAWAAEPVEPLAAAGQASTAGAAGGVGLLLAVLFALIGGVVLNLMPCVFPILSLKALGLAGRGGERSGMRRDGLAFAAGVILSFLVMAGLLMAVRASGAQVGWGYQLQSPLVVAALAALMFVIGLSLAGMFEVGTSLTRLGGLGGSGEGSSFLTGVLATVVATPCTAPFMGAAVGAALVRPPVEGLVIFGALGVGMAAPYVALAFWPGLARRLPRPGRWMETFKQVLAFPMFAVAIWLVWVFGLQTGMGGAARLLFGLLLLAFAGWLIGRWPATAITTRKRWATRALALCAVVIAFAAGVAATSGGMPLPAAGEEVAAMEWETWSAAAVEEHRSAGRPVFVDFTAAWCISCKVNERVALETTPVRRAFAEQNVALLKADWTRRDPLITSGLASFGRSGVPLYVYYPADPAAEPVVLPALLTPMIVLNILEPQETL